VTYAGERAQLACLTSGQDAQELPRDGPSGFATK
jgi:hypothetical protein